MEQLGKYGFLRRDYLKNLKKKLTTLQAQDAERIALLTTSRSQLSTVSTVHSLTTWLLA